MKDLKNISHEFVHTDNIKAVHSEQYNYIFRKNTGYFVRWGETYNDDPIFAPFGPEILDLEISIGDCSGDCPWCYKSNSIGDGWHMSFEEFKTIIDKFPPVLTQVALGLTDIKANKDLIPILKYSRKKGIVPNFTLAGYGANRDIIEECAKYVGAVAVSVYPHNKELAYRTAQMFLDAGVEQTNFHLLYYEENKGHVLDVLADYEEGIAPEVNAIVLLGLKSKGRAATGFTPMSRQNFQDIVYSCFDRDIPIGFDSCSAPRFEEYAKEHDLDYLIKYSEPCESALMSSYINVYGDFYPCSFVEGTEGWEEGISVLEAEDFLSDVWYHKRIHEWRTKLLENCRNCPVFDV